MQPLGAATEQTEARPGRTERWSTAGFEAPGLESKLMNTGRAVSKLFVLCLFRRNSVGVFTKFGSVIYQFHINA
jgi:hypothetical protein